MHLKLELFELDVCFKRKLAQLEFNLLEFVMFSYKTSIGEHSFSSITGDLLDFHTNKTVQYLKVNFFVP